MYVCKKLNISISKWSAFASEFIMFMQHCMLSKTYIGNQIWLGATKSQVLKRLHILDWTIKKRKIKYYISNFMSRLVPLFIQSFESRWQLLFFTPKGW